MTAKFVDSGKNIMHFADRFLVHCPRCQHCAVVVPHLTEHERQKVHKNIYTTLYIPRRLVCDKCGHTRDWEGKGKLTIGGNVDWYFGLPLWLQTTCCGNKELWAYNLAHLQFLENYVGATLRIESRLPHKSLVHYLPGWIKSAKNREEVLKALTRLREKALEE